MILAISGTEIPYREYKRYRIVPLLSAGQSGDLPFFTMPFIDGKPLRHP